MNNNSFEKGLISVAGTGFAIIIGSIVFAACNPKTTEERVEAYEASITVVSPRPGVECYILPGSGSSTPRAMSCVVVQR